MSMINSQKTEKKSRLSDVLTDLGINQSEFAAKIGVSPATVTEILKGRSKGFNSGSLSRIRLNYHVDINWLLTGEGSMFVEEKEEASAPISANNTEASSAVSLLQKHPKLAEALEELSISKLEIGDPLSLEEGESPRVSDRPAVELNRIELKNLPQITKMEGSVATGVPQATLGYAEKKMPVHELLGANKEMVDSLYSFEARGDSMFFAGILGGDHIIIRNDLQPQNNNMVAVNLNGDLTLKWLQICTDRVELLPDNPAYDRIIIAKDRDDFGVIGVVLGVVRKVKNRRAKPELPRFMHRGDE